MVPTISQTHGWFSADCSCSTPASVLGVVVMMTWHAHGSRTPRLRQACCRSSGWQYHHAVAGACDIACSIQGGIYPPQLWEAGLFVGHDHLGGLVYCGDSTVLPVVCFESCECLVRADPRLRIGCAGHAAQTASQPDPAQPVPCPAILTGSDVSSSHGPGKGLSSLLVKGRACGAHKCNAS